MNRSIHIIQNKTKQNKMASITIQQLRQQIVPAPIDFSPFAQQHLTKLDTFCISQNPSSAAFTYIQKYRRNFLCMMASHPAAIAYLENTDDNIIYLSNADLINPKLSKKLLDIQLNLPLNNTPYFYDILSSNPSDPVVDHLLAHPEKISWHVFCKNTNSRAVAFMKKNVEKIYWFALSRNKNTGAVCLLEENPELVDFDELSANSNPRAFKLLLTQPHRINYNNLAYNTNPEAVAYLLENVAAEYPFGLNMHVLSANPAAMDYLEKNPTKIDFPKFWENSAIFEFDYQAIFKAWLPKFKDELLMVALHPDRIDRLVKQGFTVREIVDNL